MQLAVPPLPDRVQLVKSKLPVPLLEKLTMPVGVDAPAPLVSVTVAVHVATWLTVTVPGLQVTVVEVVR